MKICGLCGEPISAPEYPGQRKHSVCQEEHRREHNRNYNRAYNRELKREVLTFYGNGKSACVLCSFADMRALTIDHINGRTKHDDGRVRGYSLYLELKRSHYPKGYQTLCMNCQYIKRVENREIGNYRKK